MTHDGEYRPIDAPPATDAAFVYAAYGGVLEAYGVDDGALRWYANLPAPLVVAPIVASEIPGVAVAAGSTWLWFDRAGRLVGRAEAPDSPIAATAVPGGIVQISPAGVTLLRAGEPGWSVELEGARTVIAGPADSSLSAALFVSAGDRVVCLGLEDGSTRWQEDDLVDVVARAAVTSRSVFVTSGKRLIALNPANGRPRWRANLIGVDIVGAPAVVDETVWIAGLDAVLHGYETGNGSELYQLSLAARTYVDLAAAAPWVVVGPHYGPWTLVRAPGRGAGTGNSPAPPSYSIEAETEIRVPPATGAAGIALVDRNGAITFLATEDLDVPSVDDEADDQETGDEGAASLSSTRTPPAARGWRNAIR